MTTTNDALEFLKSKHNGEIPYKYGYNECARWMSDFANEMLTKQKLNLHGVVRPASGESEGGELLPAEEMEQGGSDGEPYYCEFCGSDEGGHMYGCPNGKYG